MRTIKHIEVLNYLSVRVLILTLVAFMGAACGDNSEEDTEEGVTIGAGGGGSGGSSGTQSALESVADNMLPGSLDSNSSSLLLSGDDPCAEAAGFFDCQPELLKIYMGIAKNIVAMVAETVEHTSEFIDSREVGSTGSQEIDDSDDITQIDYVVTSADNYEVKLYTGDGAFIYLNVNTSEDTDLYSLIVDGSKTPDDDGPGGLISVDIEYESDEEFEVAINMVDMDCEDEDVQAPGSLGLAINKGEDSWQGKAMLAHPRWLVSDDATCSTESTDETTMYLFTDFAGNDDSTTASLYMMDSSVDSTDDFVNWPASEFCGNFTDSCSNGYGFGDPNPISTYENAFCVSEVGTAWGTECSDITSEDYTDANNWLLPEDLSSISLSMPDILD